MIDRPCRDTGCPPTPATYPRVPPPAAGWRSGDSASVQRSSSSSMPLAAFFYGSLALKTPSLICCATKWMLTLSGSGITLRPVSIGLSDCMERMPPEAPP